MLISTSAIRRAIVWPAICLGFSGLWFLGWSGNPIIPGYFADPHVLADSGKFYIYATTVSDTAGTYDQMVFWKSSDFVHWTMVKVSWPTFVVWAPDAIKGPNGRYYIYPTQASNYTEWVGVGSSPVGPFQNARSDNGALITTASSYGSYSIDAAPFIDDNGTPYLYWGWGSPRAVQLNTNMATATGTVLWLNGTKWIANGGSLPQWLQVDLSQAYEVTKCETSPEFHDRSYQYNIQYSTDNSTWSTFANRSSNTSLPNPCYTDTGRVTGRYFKITITKAGNGDWASLYEFRVFSSGTNVAIGKTPTVSSQQSSNPASFATDGSDGPFLADYVEAPYMIKRNGIYYFMYSLGRCQDETYKVNFATAPGPLGPFTPGTTNPILTSPSNLSSDGPGHHSILKIDTNYYIIYHQHDYPRTYTPGAAPDGIHRQTCADRLYFNTNGSIKKVVTSLSGVGTLGPLSDTDTNLAKSAIASASSVRDTFHAPGKAFDESYRTHWSAKGSTYPHWLKIDLGQAFAVNRCETEFEYPTVAYRYKIEYSNDNSTWYIYNDRSSNTDAQCPSIDTGTVTARYFRLTISGCAKAMNPASVWEFRVMQRRTVQVKQNVKTYSSFHASTMKIVGADLVRIPGADGSAICVVVYTPDGKKLAEKITIKGILSLSQDFGLPTGFYLIKASPIAY